MAAANIRPAAATESVAIRELLASAGLPVDDLDTSTIEWWVADREGELAGVVGLERHGQAGLLRSLAVNDRIRGGGLGRRLVERIELHARSQGLSQLVLLTQTASNFFSRLGYERVERQTIPAAVRDSAQFRSICPASAACMRKYLSGFEGN